ncbi:caspase family protein [Aquirufa beregesia]
MENYIGLIIAVENYHDDKNLNQVMFAKNDAEAFIDSLVKLGCDRNNLQYLSDNLATKTTIHEKINELSRYAAPTDTIVFYFAGHGFYHNGENLISCVDTSLTSLTTTTVEVNSILGAFDKSKSNKVIAFLDCCHSGIKFSDIERSPVTHFSTDELKYEYSNAQHLTVFASCKSEEKSQADLDRKHGVWSYFLIQALTGNAQGIYDDTILFSDKLQKYLTYNTSQRVKMITTERKNQTPVKFGKETTEKFIVADLSKLFAEREIKESANRLRFERATILTTEDGLVKKLPGFKSGHMEPKEISSYHDGWIKSISKELIEVELNDIAKEFKHRLKYKRIDIEEPIIEDGAGQLSTVDFDYIITISQSKVSANSYILTRSIENFKNSDILNRPEFNDLFKDTFDELELRLSKIINVENLIDKIEEIDNDDLIKVEYERLDTTNCRIRVKGFNGVIFITENSFKVQIKTKSSPQKLVISSQLVYETIGQQGIQKMLN